MHYGGNKSKGLVQRKTSLVLTTSVINYLSTDLSRFQKEMMYRQAFVNLIHNIRVSTLRNDVRSFIVVLKKKEPFLNGKLHASMVEIKISISSQLEVQATRGCTFTVCSKSSKSFNFVIFLKM